MTDVVTEQETELTVAPEPEIGIAPEPEKAKREPKPKAEPRRCLCSTFEIGRFDETVGTPDEEIFNTGCSGTTFSTFAQGHDARLVGFLVSGYFDGYEIRQVTDGGTVRSFAIPAEAAAVASDALGVKAAKATIRRAEIDQKKAERTTLKDAARAEKADAKAAEKAQKAELKLQAKAEKAALKAGAPPRAEVVAGSQEGDVPTPAVGHARVKIGRWEYDATINEDGSASYLDGAGTEQTVERDGYRLLQDA